MTYGVNNGAIQIELAANTIMPEGTGTRTDVLGPSRVMIMYFETVDSALALGWRVCASALRRPTAWLRMQSATTRLPTKIPC